jgi:YHS domain-containing protein
MKHSAAALVITASLLAGCAPMFVQSPGEGLSPVNAVKDGDDAHLMLFGYDVVNYFTDHKEARGSPDFKSVYKDVTFRFVSADHKKMFDESPVKYIPQYGGYCTDGIVYGIPWGGDADTWSMIDGKLYIFGGQGAKDAFMLHSERNLGLAEKYWKDEVNGSNAFVQRVYRLTIRVPHYKSGKELADEVAAAKAAGTLKEIGTGSAPH